MADNCKLLLCYMLISTFGYHSIFSATNPQDGEKVAVLRSLRDQWKNSTPPGWRKFDDPCGNFWEGVTCNNSRVTKLELSKLGLVGQLVGDIGGLTHLTSLRLDQNALNGSVPSNLNNLTSLVELSLANNEFSGPLPNLTGMHNLNYLDLSNNSFEQSRAPRWFTSLVSLSTLVIEHGGLVGSVPNELFSLFHIQQVKLRNNAFNGSLVLGPDIGLQLELVDLQNNNISFVLVDPRYFNDLILTGNPVCNTLSLADTNYCPQKPNSTNTANSGSKSGPSDKKLSALVLTILLLLHTYWYVLIFVIVLPS